MKKIFTLLAGVLFAMTASAQTATDSYLDIAQYATLDNIDLKNCTKLYSYDSEKKVLVLSAYGAYQSSVQGHGDDGLTGLAFVTYTSAGSSSVSGGWAATSDFMGSAYYGLLSGGSASDRAAAIKAANAYTYKVTGCEKVSILGKSGKKTDRQVIMTVKEGDNTVAEKIDDTNNIVELSVDGLDPAKTYDVTVTGNTGDNGHFYEIAFYQPGGTDTPDTPADPHAATQWDLTKPSEADIANLDADANWTYDEEKSRYTYGVAFTSAEGRQNDIVLKANGQELDVVKGLFFGRDGSIDANKFGIDKGKGINLPGSKYRIILTELAKNDKIKVRLTGSSDGDRGVELTNVGTSNTLTSTDKAVAEGEFAVAEDGLVIIETTGGLTINALAINAELPVVTGISTIKAENAANAAMYDLSGRRVDTNYRGVVIVNGVKKIQK